MFGSTVAHTHSIAQSKNTKRLQRSGKGPLHNGLFMQCSFILNLVLGFLQTQLQISHCIFSKMVSTHTHQYQGDRQNRPGPPAPRGGSARPAKSIVSSMSWSPNSRLIS